MEKALHTLVPQGEEKEVIEGEVSVQMSVEAWMGGWIHAGMHKVILGNP
jgi:hypothetical protein